MFPFLSSIQKQLILVLAVLCTGTVLASESLTLQVSVTTPTGRGLSSTDQARAPIAGKESMAPGEGPMAPPVAADKRKVDPSTLPMIFWHSQPVRANETLLLSGGNFSPKSSIDVCKLPDEEPGRPTAFDAAMPELRWRPLGILQITERVAQAVMPADSNSVYACRVRTGTLIGAPRLVNAPQAWFAQGDQGESATPGGWIGVFGTCIAMSSNRLPPGIRADLQDSLQPKSKAKPKAKAKPSVDAKAPIPRLALVGRGQVVRILTARQVGGSRYGQYFDLPNDCPQGVFEVYVHNGYGGPQAWTRLSARVNENVISTITVAHAESPPESGIDVSRISAQNDDERFAKAVAASRIGGTIFVPAGKYVLTKPLVLPHKSVLRGAGQGKTMLEWTADPKDGKGTLLPLISGIDGVIAENGVRGNGSFSIEDISLVASPSFEGYIIARKRTATPAYFRRIAARMPLKKNFPDGGVLYLSQTKNIEVSQCDWDAFKVIVANAQVSHLRCVDSHFRYRGIYLWLMRSHQNIIFEHNRTTMAGTWSGNGFTAKDTNEGFVYSCYDNTNSDDLYFANNLSDREESEPPHYSEGITFDGSKASYLGRIAAVSGTKISLATETIDADRYGRQAGPGSMVRIISGRGAGQWRYVVSKLTARVKELEIDSAWNIEPDSSSWLAVSNSFGRTLFVGNQFANEAVLQIWYSTEDVVFAENIMGMAGMHTGVPVWTDAGRNAWHFQILDNQVIGQQVAMTTVQPASGTPQDYTGQVTGTQVYRNNRAMDPKTRFTISIPGRTAGFLIENNSGVAEIDSRKATNSLGIIRHNTTSSGSALKPLPSPGEQILIIP